MTVTGRGHSLPQARSEEVRQGRNGLTHRWHHHQTHGRLHRRIHARKDDDTRLVPRSKLSTSYQRQHLPNQLQAPAAETVPPADVEEVRRRQQVDAGAGDATNEIIQVVEVVEIVDETGIPVTTSTSGPSFLNSTSSSQQGTGGTGSTSLPLGTSGQDPLSPSESSSNSEDAAATTTVATDVTSSSPTAESSSPLLLPASSSSSPGDVASQSPPAAETSTVIDDPASSFTAPGTALESAASSSIPTENVSIDSSLPPAATITEAFLPGPVLGTSSSPLPITTPSSQGLSASNLSPSTPAASLIESEDVTTRMNGLNMSGSSSADSIPSTSTSQVSYASTRTTTSFTTSTTSSSTTSSSKTTSSTISSSSSSTTFLAGGGNTGGGNGGSGRGAGADQSGNPGVGTANPSGGEDDGPTTGTIVGGVFGSIAGIAILAILAVFIFRRYKRLRNPPLASGSSGSENGPSSTRGILTGPSGGGSGASMTEHSSLPFFIPASLAALPGSNRAPSGDSSGTQKGFERVAGRKLPSVLTHGGDGYSDPRGSVFSGTSFYRDSQGFYGGPGNSRLAVGSPMRPESGIMVVKSGPARTPVTEQNPFADPVLNPFADPISEGSAHQSLSPPRPLRDDVGRSLTSQDGSRVSRGSGSRFTEEI